jgi:hypothetical protein
LVESSGGLARFDIPNDALHLRRKTNNKKILEIVANSAQVNYISRFFITNCPQKTFLTCVQHSEN